MSPMYLDPLGSDLGRLHNFSMCHLADRCCAQNLTGLGALDRLDLRDLNDFHNYLLHDPHLWNMHDLHNRIINHLVHTLTVESLWSSEQSGPRGSVSAPQQGCSIPWPYGQEDSRPNLSRQSCWPRRKRHRHSRSFIACCKFSKVSVRITIHLEVKHFRFISACRWDEVLVHECFPHSRRTPSHVKPAAPYP